MKNLSAPLAAAALLAASILGSGMPSSAADDVNQTAIQSAYNDACTALKAGDIDTAVKRMSPDYTVTDPDGKKMDRAAIVPMMKAQLAQLTVTGCSAKITAFAKDGDTYVVTTQQILDATIPTQSNAPVRAVSANKDTWKLVSGNWEELAGLVTENTITMNGTVIMHQGAPTPAPSAKP